MMFRESVLNCIPYVAIKINFTEKCQSTSWNNLTRGIHKLLCLSKFVP